MHVHGRVYMHVHGRVYMHVHGRVYMHVHGRVYMHVHGRVHGWVYMHVHTWTGMHACTWTGIHACTCTWMSDKWRKVLIFTVHFAPIIRNVVKCSNSYPGGEAEGELLPQNVQLPPQNFAIINWLILLVCDS